MQVSRLYCMCSCTTYDSYIHVSAMQSAILTKSLSSFWDSNILKLVLENRNFQHGNIQANLVKLFAIIMTECLRYLTMWKVMIVFTNEDKIPVKGLRKDKHYSVKKLKEFPDKLWSCAALDELLQKINSMASLPIVILSKGVGRGRCERGKGMESEGRA